MMIPVENHQKRLKAKPNSLVLNLSRDPDWEETTQKNDMSMMACYGMGILSS